MTVARKALSDKVLLLGVDGMDPRLTRKYVDMGLMPNVKKYIEKGSARHDLVMLGGHPTVTPPMWTTLATGCYANVHGITGFSRNAEDDISKITYNLDSRLCQAEQLWNVFAEAGKKTLVWHWPGSAWPPSSDSPNLMVIDGTSPGSVGMAVAQVEPEFILNARAEYKQPIFSAKGEVEANAACAITDLELDDGSAKQEDATILEKIAALKNGIYFPILNESQMTTAATEIPVDRAFSPIKEATGWANAPADAKEFTLLLSGGLIRRPGLILKGENGDYDRVAIYKTKKDAEPIVVLTPKVMVTDVIDESMSGDTKYAVNRNLKVLELSADGQMLDMFVSAAMDITNDSVYSPKSLHKELIENVGYPTPTSMLGCQDKQLITDCMLANWYTTADWQSKSILHLIESEDLDVIFSHFHAIDLQSHQFIKHLADRDFNRLEKRDYEKFMEDIYIQTDYYLGKFIHLLDEGWTIMIFSDHAQVAPKHDLPFLGDAAGVNVRVMEELGFTVLKRDENGNELPEIDWSKTRAVAPREGHIYLNIKGREKYGIVDPADKYELEEEIMTALYGYKDKKTGHRVVSVALRNKDAVLLGMGGPETGDIFYCVAEGYNFDHCDSLSTTFGEGDTSVSPIFIAAGAGIKENFATERIVRQIDFAPTVAVVGGVRMPAQCEGAPVYQILSEEY